MGTEIGSFHHPLFLRNHPELDCRLERRKVKGNNNDKKKFHGGPQGHDDPVKASKEEDAKATTLPSTSNSREDRLGMLETPFQMLDGRSDASIIRLLNVDMFNGKDAATTASFLNRLPLQEPEQILMVEGFSSNTGIGGANKANSANSSIHLQSSITEAAAKCLRLPEEDPFDDFVSIDSLFPENDASCHDDLDGVSLEPRPIEEMILFSYDDVLSLATGLKTDKV